MQYLAFILVAALLNACSDKFIEMKKSPCALNAPMMQGACMSNLQEIREHVNHPPAKDGWGANQKHSNKHC
ncbi:hypothetical protein HSHS1_13230 [Helicobacter suis HS1]|nr:hypothetical protein HSHS1_13230 [Helicobacter suis HS1]